MLTIDEICAIICEHFELDCNSEDYSIEFIIEDTDDYGYAIIEWHIIDKRTNQDSGPTFAIISSFGKIFECHQEFGKSEKEYREAVEEYIGELRAEAEAKEEYEAEQCALWDEYEIYEINRQFNDMMTDFDAWGNID